MGVPRAWLELFGAFPQTNENPSLEIKSGSILSTGFGAPVSVRRSEPELRYHARRAITNERVTALKQELVFSGLMHESARSPQGLERM